MPRVWLVLHSLTLSSLILHHLSLDFFFGLLLRPLEPGRGSERETLEAPSWGTRLTEDKLLVSVSLGADVGPRFDRSFEVPEDTVVDGDRIFGISFPLGGDSGELLPFVEGREAVDERESGDSSSGVDNVELASAAWPSSLCIALI